VRTGQISPSNLPFEVRRYAKAVAAKGDGYEGEGYDELLQGSA
jgi:hypothetical protein